MYRKIKFKGKYHSKQQEQIIEEYTSNKLNLTLVPTLSPSTSSIKGAVDVVGFTISCSLGFFIESTAPNKPSESLLPY
jgi:hypothetical protein